jgi:hypothetical protein
MTLTSAWKKFTRSTRSRRLQKSLNRDLREEINLIENAEKAAENDPLDHQRLMAKNAHIGHRLKAVNAHTDHQYKEAAEDHRLRITVVERTVIGVGEESGVDRQG